MKAKKKMMKNSLKSIREQWRSLNVRESGWKRDLHPPRD